MCRPPCFTILLRLARVARGLKLLRFLVESDLSWTQHPAFESFMMGMIVLNAIVRFGGEKLLEFLLLSLTILA